jgi:tetratricopeptide (TPR) repeat protein
VIQKGSHVLGDGVNIAARLEPLAPPEGICISEDVARQVQNKLEIPLNKLGQRNLKNIQFPMEIYSVNLPWQAPDEQATLMPEKRSGIAAQVPLAKKSTKILWYIIPGVALAGAAALYVLMPKTLSPPAEQSKPAVRVETLRVKEPALTKVVTQRGKADSKQILRDTQQAKQIASRVEAVPVDYLQQADSIFQIGLLEYKGGGLAAARIKFDEALVLYDRMNATVQKGKALHAKATVLFYQDELKSAKQMYEEAARLLEAGGEKEAAALAQIGAARVLIETNSFSEAEAAIQKLVEATPSGSAAAAAHALLAYLAIVREQSELAKQEIEQAEKAHTRGKDAMVDMLVATVRGRMEVVMGRSTQDMRREGQTLLGQMGDVAGELEARYTFAEVALATSRSAAQTWQRRNPRRAGMQAGQRLESLRSEAQSKGFSLIARKLTALMNKQ